MAESTLWKKKLEGKVAIVTGGASGIGEVTAHVFAKHGARMVVIADVKAMVEWTVKNYGRSDQTVLDLDLSALDHLFAINVRGTTACVKHSTRAMVERGVRGTIVCTASIAASRDAFQKIDYYMSKHAVLGLVRSASTQLGEHGVRVNCVSPAVVATPMSYSAFGMDAEQLHEAFESHSSLKGVALKAEHVADATLFLASDDSGFVNGHDLLVDGGWLD
ncbi:hypothetical protein I3843_12G019400 [Carya illinoinensis]|uniref:Uncharacterized protein n=1 Tax=Carya illinoinensis TaxID=32201 RepID=A0A8T1NV38_CARIL|nr:hypothetical protein CIPAW_12G020200 [Carya illinoinensis]KAG6683539.1 hypothetical protein I3842_12G018500 [Carya illinoinensis]KAG6683540.1 hypothetical protein I3842_12G018600 [Carya illinoinensis]KAG7951674.1 hypothetical protein I3843_12G019400 [Carya illinoinensis]